jgi:hypothetical protein
MRGVRQLLPNNAMQTDKVNLSRLYAARATPAVGAGELGRQTASMAIGSLT